jgi:hypothetical protein
MYELNGHDIVYRTSFVLPDLTDENCCLISNNTLYLFNSNQWLVYINNKTYIIDELDSDNLLVDTNIK